MTEQAAPCACRGLLCTGAFVCRQCDRPGCPPSLAIACGDCGKSLCRTCAKTVDWKRCGECSRWLCDDCRDDICAACEEENTNWEKIEHLLDRVVALCPNEGMLERVMDHVSHMSLKRKASEPE